MTQNCFSLFLTGLCPKLCSLIYIEAYLSCSVRKCIFHFYFQDNVLDFKTRWGSPIDSRPSVPHPDNSTTDTDTYFLGNGSLYFGHIENRRSLINRKNPAYLDARFLIVVSFQPTMQFKNSLWLDFFFNWGYLVTKSYHKLKLPRHESTLTK